MYSYASIFSISDFYINHNEFIKEKMIFYKSKISGFCVGFQSS